MVKLVEQMLELHQRQAGAASQSDRETARPAVSGVDKLVASRELYGLTDEEIKIVEGAE